MRIDKSDGTQERQILISLIVDHVVLAKIAPHWKKDLFNSRWSNLIGGWCVDYYKKYQKAPNKAIESIFKNWAEKGRDPDTIKLIDKFLNTLSEEYETLSKDSNSEYILDLATEHFDRVKIKNLVDALQGDLDTGAIQDAKTRVDSFERTDISGSDGIDVLLDEDSIRETFEQRGDVLIHYPGDLGVFFGNCWERGNFVAFMGPEKRGKSQWLIDVAWRGMLERRRVAFFEIGDLSKNQIMGRFMSRASRRPMYKTTDSSPLMYPISLTHDRTDKYAKAKFKSCHFKNDMSFESARDAFKEVMQKKLRSDESYLKLVVRPSNTLSIEGLNSIVLGWERQGWVPDIIVLDYADILAPSTMYKEKRDQIGVAWAGLRSISQRCHALVVTATQSDSASYNVYQMDRSHFSDSKTKLAHVRSMIGINAMPCEEELFQARLNWIVIGEEAKRKQVFVVGAPGLANPAVKFCW
jgi:hypothetical protein